MVFAASVSSNTTEYSVKPLTSNEIPETIQTTLPPRSPVIANKEVKSEYKPEQNVYCSCVLTLKEEIPDLPNLDAIDFPINTITPKVGDIIKIQYYNATTSNYVYHLQRIREIKEESYVVYQGNKPSCATSSEEVRKDDQRILGYFSMDRQRLIDQLTPIQKETLWNESGWSMYKHNAVLRGRNGEWGVIQMMPQTWKEMSDKRQSEHLRMLDKMSFEDEIEMFRFGWSHGVVWYGKPK